MKHYKNRRHAENDNWIPTERDKRNINKEFRKATQFMKHILKPEYRRGYW